MNNFDFILAHIKPALNDLIDGNISFTKDSPVSVFQTHSQASTYPREHRHLVSRQAAKHGKKLH